MPKLPLVGFGYSVMSLRSEISSSLIDTSILRLPKLLQVSDVKESHCAALLNVVAGAVTVDFLLIVSSAAKFLKSNYFGNGLF